MSIYSLGDHTPTLPAPDRYWVAPGAHVIGRVILGHDVSVWFGAVIRGDNEEIELGDATNVQEGAMLHTDPGFRMSIGPGCTIGHHAILHGCSVGEGSLIGMGATLLNGVKIGARCLVGANALVTEGKEFPDHSLIIGSPAKAVRTLDAAAVERFREIADGYVRRWRSFKSDLKQIG